MQDAKIKNCNLQQQIRELIQKSAKCKLHARFFPLISFCKLRQKFGCKKFLISKYPPLAYILLAAATRSRAFGHSFYPFLDHFHRACCLSLNAGVYFLRTIFWEAKLNFLAKFYPQKLILIINS